MIVAVCPSGRAVAVVHGRAWPSCVWPWCRVRLCVVVMSWRPGCVCGVALDAAPCCAVARLCGDMRSYDTPINASVSNGFMS